MEYKDIISNVRVYGVEESIVASGYPMLTKPYSESEFESACEDVINNSDSPHIKRSVKLAGTGTGEGHDNFLNGIITQFDLRLTIKAWTEAERYHFFDFVSSMSTMHRLSKMDFDTSLCPYITDSTKNELITLLAKYNENPCEETKLALLYNCPTGLQLTARMSTNYRQLKTIFKQRKNHLLPEWKAFCKWVKTLPYAKEFITLEKENNT